MARKRDKQRTNPTSGLSALKQLIEEYSAPDRPEGWHTAEELAVMTGAGSSTIRRALYQKKVPFKMFRVRIGTQTRILKCYQVS